MKRSHAKIYIHYIWGTKFHKKILQPDKRLIIIEHIKNYCSRREIDVLALGGSLEHLHLLAEIPPRLSVSESINLVKGESSHWINDNDIFREKFVWQIKYAAFSVSRPHLDIVKKYINYQESYHRENTFQQEVIEMYQKFNINVDDIEILR